MIKRGQLEKKRLNDSMKYLPYETHELETSLPFKEVYDRIYNCLENEEFFKGQINENKFKIRRKIWYRNDFRPIIEGIIWNHNNGSKIKIIMRLSKITLAGFIIISLFMLFFCLIIIASLSNHPRNINFGYFIPIIIIIFEYSLSMIGFKPEAKKAKKLLENLIKN